MRIKKTTSRFSEHYSIIQDIVKNGKRTTKVYENIGDYSKVEQRAGSEEPMLWLKKYVKSLNEKNKKEKLPVIFRKNIANLINKDEEKLTNVGYLFLKKIYHNLGLDKICDKIQSNYKFEYKLNDILSSLVYTRILYPSSKRKSHELSKKLLFNPKFDLHQVYKSLDIIAENSDFIQSELYKNSKKFMKRNDTILYYDCTNYFFETNQGDGLRQYGLSKEHRPNPLVQMGLFLDADGIPLAFNINAGNTNEQLTLRPLEEKIIKDFKHSHFVVCTDAGLASTHNRKFNNVNGRSFITAQPVKKLKSYLKEYSLDMSNGWKISGSNKTYDLSKLHNDKDFIEKYKDVVFYKERWINENGLEQRLIITFSTKYQEFQRKIREKQISRAVNILEKNPQKVTKARANDPKRLIKKTNFTVNGEIAENSKLCLDENLILDEMKYDGIYAVCTNLNDKVEDIIRVNRRRWEIEESFRIMKNEFKARPVYLSKDNRIEAHFTTCFLALVIYRYLEKILEEKYTVCELIETLQGMDMLIEKDSYLPAYKRTNITDDLHEKFGFRTDFEAIRNEELKNIFATIKS